MDDKERLLQEAKNAFDSKDFKKAQEIYQSLLENDSENPDVNYGFACACKAMKNDSEAISAFEAALKARPGWPCAVQEYSELLLAHRKTKNAFELVKASLESNPQNASLSILAGRILMRQSNYAAACEYLLKSLEVEQNSAVSYSLLSDCYFRLSQISEGLDAAINAEKYADEQKKPEMQKKCVGAYLFSGQIESALPYLSSFSVDTCDDVQTLDLLGRMAIFNDDETALKSCAEKVSKLDGDYYDYLVSWALCYRIRGKHEKSRELFNEYLSENKKDAVIWSELGKTDELLGDVISAFDEYSTALAFDPANFLAKDGEKRLEPKEEDESTVSSEPIGEEVDFDFLMDSDFSLDEPESETRAETENAGNEDGEADAEETGEVPFEDFDDVDTLPLDEDDEVDVSSGDEKDDVVILPLDEIDDLLADSNEIQPEPQMRPQPQIEEKAASPYADMMAQVADLLPKIEKIIANQDDAEKFAKEVELFERLRALGSLLPDAQKRLFMQSKIRVVLEFLIARFSGKPGLLKTADSLRKSGVIDSELQNKNADSVVSLEQCSFAERLSVVLNDMCDFAKSLEDKCLSAALIEMAKEIETRLEE